MKNAVNFTLSHFRQRQCEVSSPFLWNLILDLFLE